jgi:hypothetical protein
MRPSGDRARQLVAALLWIIVTALVWLALVAIWAHVAARAIPPVYLGLVPTLGRDE